MLGTGPDATIARTVKQLMFHRGIEVAEFCAAIGMSQPTYYGRMAGRSKWGAAEAVRAAAALGVPVQVLCDGLDLAIPGGDAVVGAGDLVAESQRHAAASAAATSAARSSAT